MKIIDRIMSKFIDRRVEYLHRENEQLKIRNEVLESQYKNLFLSVKNFFDSKEKKDAKTWRLIEVDGEELWFRPEHLTYVGKITEEKGMHSFNIIIDTNLLTIVHSSKEECNNIRFTLLNVDRIPTSEDVSEEKKKARIVRVFSKENVVAPKIETKSKIDVEQLGKTIKNKRK